MKQFERNPRKITDKQLEKLEANIRELGDISGIVHDLNTDEIISGNQRCKAIDINACEIVLTEQYEEPDAQGTVAWGYAIYDGHKMNYRQVRWTQEQRDKANITANSLGGDWDWDILRDEWDWSKLEEWDLEVPDDIKAGWEEEEEHDAREDDFTDEDAEQAEPRVKLGDIWQLGGHRLMCGDSTDAASVALLMDGKKADMVFTDPPYGVSIGDKNKALNSVQPSGRCTENIANDNIGVDDLFPILVKAMTNCRENCKDCACYYVTSPQGGELGLMMMMMMKDAGLPVRHMLIWEKNSATFSLGRLDYDYQHEPIFYTWTKSHKNYRKGEYRTTIWKYDKPRKCDLHPTMKPVELVANCMNDATVEGDIVLDMFGGSGTTIIAAEQLGRKARVMELDPHYCDVIIARWEKLTGKKAVKTETHKDADI